MGTTQAPDAHTLPISPRVRRHFAIAGRKATVFVQFERRIISQRKRDALAVKKAQGVQFGRPLSVAPAARARITELRCSGLSWDAVAAAMIDEGWSTGHGGRWLGNTVRRIWLAEHPAA